MNKEKLFKKIIKICKQKAEIIRYKKNNLIIMHQGKATVLFYSTKNISKKEMEIAKNCTYKKISIVNKNKIKISNNNAVCSDYAVYNSHRIVDMDNISLEELTFWYEGKKWT